MVTKQREFTLEDRERAKKSRDVSKSPVNLLKDQRKTFDPAIAKRLEQMPSWSRIRYMKAMRGKSPTTAITAFCLECVGWQRQEVSLCTAPACPLYPYRPFRPGSEENLEEEEDV